MRAKMKYIISLALSVVVVFSVIGCGPTGPDGGDGGGGTKKRGGGGGGTPLNFFEKELSGLWYRYHSYDSTDEYIYFEADRTACKWEENSGSEVRKKVGSYRNWSVDPNPIGDNKYRVTVPGSGLTWVFDYGNMVIYPDGCLNLKRYRSNDGKTCQ